MVHELLIKKLHEKFGENIFQSIQDNNKIVEEVEVKAKAICYLGEIIGQDQSISTTQRKVLNIYNEIFTDITIALYLCSCAIDTSSRILLRRVLELGIATVYLWDFPSKYWSWSQFDEHNNDLNFNDMVEYINNRGYIYFINHENNSNVDTLIGKDRVSRLYRELSNTIHGKMATFESLDEKRFLYQKSDFESLMQNIIAIENTLLTLWKKRFPGYFTNLELYFPTLTRYKDEY